MFTCIVFIQPTRLSVSRPAASLARPAVAEFTLFTNNTHVPDVTVSTVITYSVFSITDRRLLFVNTLSCIYRPTGRRSLDAVIVALLLLLGGVEPNPGPPMGLRLGLINARSAVGKTAVIQTVIESHQLDVLVITETWMNADQPPAVVNDIAPSDYLAVHQFRGAGSGGGVAIVYRRHLKLSVVNISSTATSFEHLTVKLTTKNRRVNLTAIYVQTAFDVAIWSVHWSLLRRIR